MTVTGHAIIGTLIAAKISNPYLAVPIAMISHLLADLTPHWDAGTHYPKKAKWRLIIDSTIDVVASIFAAYLVTIFFFPHTNILYVYLMVLAAQSFDWLTAPYYFLNMRFPPFNWIATFCSHFDNRLDKPWGIIIQVGILVALLLAVLIF